MIEKGAIVKMKLTVTSSNAQRIWDWMHNRGGVAVWQSINLSNPGASWTTPALTEDGKQYDKPTWQVDDRPTIITDPAEVEVAFDKEVGRFHVAIRRAEFSLKVTDGGSRRIRRAVANAGEGAYHIFDYATQEAVIMAPEKTMPLIEWHETRKAAE